MWRIDENNQAAMMLKMHKDFVPGLPKPVIEITAQVARRDVILLWVTTKRGDGKGWHHRPGEFAIRPEYDALAFIERWLESAGNLSGAEVRADVMGRIASWMVEQGLY